MTTEEHLIKIKAKCAQLLELSSRRAPGKWKLSKRLKGLFICLANAYKVGEPSDVCRIWNCSRSEGNADFIAACAGPAEAGWRATIIAIVESQEHQYIGEPESDYFERQPLIIKQIIAAWPEELL
jgi:hypothetical protein